LTKAVSNIALTASFPRAIKDTAIVVSNVASSRWLIRSAPEENNGRCIVPLVQLVLVLIVVGVLLWLINRFVPMQGTIKSILNGVVVIAVVLWLLNVFGLVTSLSKIHVGR
jgi:riboflavin transporter FmnP